MKLKYKRLMLKLSGEVLADKSGAGIDFSAVAALARRIKSLNRIGCEVALVVGGGNFWRYRDNSKCAIERQDSDTIGMLATVMNGIIIFNALKGEGLEARVMSGIAGDVAEIFDSKFARGHLKKGRVVICAGGTGLPFFTTDTAAALRALQLNCDVYLKATKVDGVYDKDPIKYKGAKKFDSLSFGEALEKDLKVMDLTAISLCKDNNLPVIVLDYWKKGNLEAVVTGKKIGTLIS
ncbi:MAG: uridylate kinase [uncultured bacterium]|nr:MAG: uridylate kinase [uncultured bacterium]OGJ48596.1 MAG: UMP kinase [Candidatus Peregrinibacteria bacterium RIFOXYB12_FULL_41_12]OGJ48687.1 MAG: UMP kinase [Candidatus Peregrinibacteria bacterium RIFOXYA2_FULL_41_18]